MTTLTTEDRARLRDLASKATPGPWVINTEGWADIGSGPDSVIHAYSVHDSCHECGEPYDHDPRVALSVEDAEFIAAARTALPALLNALDEAEVARELLWEAGESTAQEAVGWRQKALNAEAAVERVREMHAPERPGTRDRDGHEIATCALCRDADGWPLVWPCPTVRAIEGDA